MGIIIGLKWMLILNPRCAAGLLYTEGSVDPESGQSVVTTVGSRLQRVVGGKRRMSKDRRL